MAATRQRKPKTEYQKSLKAFHEASGRHVVTVEANLPYPDKHKVFHYADLLRKAGNELVAVMKHNYEQLIRTKRYRKLKELYGKYSESKNEKARKNIARQMAEMQKQYNVTWDYCRTSMIPIKDKYGIDAVFALSKAEDVWKGMEKCLFSNGEMIHFSSRGDLPVIRARQINRGIVIKVDDNKLAFKWNGITFGTKYGDRFQNDEMNAVVNYLAQPEVIDRKAVESFKKNGKIISTYRPCYASLVCERIRGKCRVFIHITLEGRAFPKYDKNGNKRHKYGVGVIGSDIGTQTVAYTSETEVGLKNMAERGSSIKTNERTERLLYRAMDRSRRAMNPGNYNEDGTIKKGRKVWKNSKRYRKLREKHRALCRKNSINRHLAINEDINHLRSLGDVFVTEPKNASKLMKKAKETTVNKDGKNNRKKRFGKSIKNRCGGYFQAQAERKFTSTGGAYHEVPNTYRASQYDHTLDDYVKKKLSERMFYLSNGKRVQRDWYSSFLLFNIDFETDTIDKNKCNMNFDKLYEKQLTMIKIIKDNHIHVLNSGIKVAC